MYYSPYISPCLLARIQEFSLSLFSCLAYSKPLWIRRIHIEKDYSTHARPKVLIMYQFIRAYLTYSQLEPPRVNDHVPLHVTPI